MMQKITSPRRILGRAAADRAIAARPAAEPHRLRGSSRNPVKFLWHGFRYSRIRWQELAESWWWTTK
jgi:hypothetical protein